MGRPDVSSNTETAESPSMSCRFGRLKKKLKVKYACYDLRHGFATRMLMNDRDSDNPGAPIFMGLLIVFPSIVVATTAAVFERILQNAVDLKSENDLTV